MVHKTINVKGMQVPTGAGFFCIGGSRKWHGEKDIYEKSNNKKPA